MRHKLVIEGHGFRLRPIEDADAAFVMGLRSDSALNRYLHPGATTVEDQLAWFADYHARAGDYYFVLERRDSGAPEGVISLYDVDTERRSGEWGRWILKPESLGAVESAWLIYRCGFEALKLSAVYCRTVAHNTKVVSFHDSCGIKRQRRLGAHFRLGEQMFDAIEHRVEQQEWPQIASRLDPLAKMTARRMSRA